MNLASRIVVSSSFVLIASLSVGCAPDPYANGSGLNDDGTMARVATNEKVDNGDGTWSFAIERNFDASKEVQEGQLAWRYVGQARYSNVSKGRTGEVSYIQQAPKTETLTSQLRNTSRWNADGSMWELASVPGDDGSAIDSGSDEPIEDEIHPVDGPDEDVAPGTVVTWTPMNWTSQLNCDGNTKNGDEVEIWDSESRSSVPTPTGRDRTAVTVTASFGGGPDSFCPGVVMNSTHVLTADHCMFDANGNHNTGVTVWLLWAGESRSVSAEFDDNAFNPPTDPDDDFVILRLSSAFTNSPGDMDFSDANDATLNAVGENFHDLGFPRFFPGCTPVSLGSLILTHASDYDLTYKGSQSLRWTGDGSLGQSGSPVYFCPTGDDTVCATSDKGVVVAVFAGWNGFWQRFVGPRVSHFRDWAGCITGGGNDSCLPL